MQRLAIALLTALVVATGVDQFPNRVQLPLIIAPVADTPTTTPTATATGMPTATPTVTPTRPSSGPCSCNANTLNCSDFSSQSSAQACFDFCRSQGAGDIHLLDSDNDGEACESLPGGFTIIR